MKESELTPAEEDKFDHLTEQMNPYEAWKVIRSDREEAIGAHAVAETLTQQESLKKPQKNSWNKGGNSFSPGVPYRDLDPHTNGKIVPEPVKDEQASRKAFDRLVEDVDKAEILSIESQKEVSHTQATVIRIVRKAKN